MSPPATPAFTNLLREKIARDGPLTFAGFMALALYHPEHGYYAKQNRQVGRAGDFYTSVSVGPLFGKLLARRFLNWWETSGSPEKWRIIEAGAHDGTLAADILSELLSLNQTASAALEYVIDEPLPLLKATQQRKLEPFANVRFTDPDHPDRSVVPLPGIAFGNEVLDALPFHVIQWADGRWHECLVENSDDGFAWKISPDPLDESLQPQVAPLGTGFPEGYRTEVRTCFQDFFKPLLSQLSSGLLLFPDYGFATPDYYHPDRTSGTLRTFSKHQADENPLIDPGNIDITAHVDFTAAAKAATALGCRPISLKSQASFLTALARDWLISLEGNPDASGLRQFQSLTHPAQLGGKFHILELAWNDPAAPEISAADRHRLAFE